MASSSFPLPPLLLLYLLYDPYLSDLARCLCQLAVSFSLADFQRWVQQSSHLIREHGLVAVHHLGGNDL